MTSRSSDKGGIMRRGAVGSVPKMAGVLTDVEGAEIGRVGAFLDGPQHLGRIKGLPGRGPVTGPRRHHCRKAHAGAMGADEHAAIVDFQEP